MRYKLVVFDLNKTLIKENSWYVLNLAMGVTEAEDRLLMARASRGEITDQQGQDYLLDIYQKRGNTSRQAIEQALAGYTYMPHAKEVIKYLQRRHIPAAIISGAMDILIARVARELNVDLWRASNQFVFDDKDMLVQIISPINDVNDKLRQLESLCEERGIKLSDCLVVGDGANDEALFKATKNGITFVGSPIVRSARYLIESLHEIMEIVEQ